MPRARAMVPRVRARRKIEWAGFGDEVGAAAPVNLIGVGAGGLAILSFNVVVQAGVGLIDQEVTITRILGELFARTNAGAAATCQFAVGCYVADNRAVAAGAGSLPRPLNDPDESWLWHYYGVLRQDAATQNFLSLSEMLRVPIQSRAQRIMHSGETVVWVAEAGDNTLQMSVAGRYLVKLP